MKLLNFTDLELIHSHLFCLSQSEFIFLLTLEIYGTGKNPIISLCNYSISNIKVIPTLPSSPFPILQNVAMSCGVYPTNTSPISLMFLNCMHPFIISCTDPSPKLQNSLMLACLYTCFFHIILQPKKTSSFQNTNLSLICLETNLQ